MLSQWIESFIVLLSRIFISISSNSIVEYSVPLMYIIIKLLTWELYMAAIYKKDLYESVSFRWNKIKNNKLMV